MSKRKNRLLVVFFLNLLCSFLISFSVAAEKTQVATFAGGSFWFLQPAFDNLPGVIKTEVGYAGGKESKPTYEDVALGETGHVEAIQITFDPSIISYEKLLDIFWHNIDPTDPNGQFCDKGDQYRTIIFYHSKEQDLQAQRSKELLIKNNMKNIYTSIRPYTTFYPAEAEHQEYYKKNPAKYKYYLIACGREKKLKELWK